MLALESEPVLALELEPVLALEPEPVAAAALPLVEKRSKPHPQAS